MTQTILTPGVYRQTRPEPPEPTPLRTGVPAFLGFCGEPGPPGVTEDLAHFEHRFPDLEAESLLRLAVRGFFDNQGSRCLVVGLDPDLDLEQALGRALDRLDAADFDLLCAPDLMPSSLPQDELEQRFALQRALLDHCAARGDCFAILDPPPGTDVDGVLRQRQALGGAAGAAGALYFPWIHPQGDAPKIASAPPCGHVAGVYARTDETVGVHKAPANLELAGACDLERMLDPVQVRRLHTEGVNALRSIPGRGLRIWGARTLSRDPAWKHVPVSRLFRTLRRWVSVRLLPLAFEPNHPKLWSRIDRDLTLYLSALWASGALAGNSAEEAFFVQCDAETNPPEVRRSGRVVTRIGLAPITTGETLIVRLVQNADGVLNLTTTNDRSPQTLVSQEESP